MIRAWPGQTAIIAAALIVLVLSGCDAWARLGTVRTRDGRTYEGQVRLDTRALVVANVERNYLVEIPSTNLLEALFQNDPDSATTFPLALTPTKVPFPWSSADIGTAVDGEATVKGEVFQLASTGTNILGDCDAFHFVYKRVRGNSEIVARVLTLYGISQKSKAGLMMRETLKPDSRNVLLALQAGRGGVFQWRPGNGQDTELEPKREMFLPAWIKLKREGDSFAAYRSRNGRQWSAINRVNLPMTNEIFVGVAVTGSRHADEVDASNFKTRSTLDQVQEAPSLPRSSFIPQVKLLSGSIVRGRIRAADESWLHVPGAPPLPIAHVSTIQFDWVPFRFTAEMASLRPGALLAEGAFVDGEFKRIDQGRLVLSSVLFGLRNYDINSDIIAVNVRKGSRVNHQCEVTTINGSRWLGTSLEIEANEVVLQDASVGIYRIPIYDLAEVRRMQ